MSSIQNCFFFPFFSFHASAIDSSQKCWKNYGQNIARYGVNGGPLGWLPKRLHSWITATRLGINIKMRFFLNFISLSLTVAQKRELWNGELSVILRQQINIFRMVYFMAQQMTKWRRTTTLYGWCVCEIFLCLRFAGRPNDRHWNHKIPPLLYSCSSYKHRMDICYGLLAHVFRPTPLINFSNYTISLLL